MDEQRPIFEPGVHWPTLAVWFLVIFGSAAAWAGALIAALFGGGAA